jgi:hypothetical protein
MKIKIGLEGLPRRLYALATSSPDTQFSEGKGLTDNLLFENEVPHKLQVPKT